MAGAQELAQYEEYVFQIDTENTFTTPTTIARVSSATINDAFDVQQVDDFDQAIGDIVDQVLGGRTVNIPFTANLMLSDAGFVAINAAFKTGALSYLSIQLVDTESSATTWTVQFSGYWSQRTVNMQKPAASIDWSFAATAVLSDDITS